jgi:APA family basic amino acid/polyamine antiporter
MLLGGAHVARLLSPLVAICVLSSLQATVLVGPRIYQVMATDGVFFRALGRTHATTGAPVLALAAQGVVAAALLVLGSLDPIFDLFSRLLDFTMFAIVAFSTLAVAAVVVLRVRRPDIRRPFRVPGYPVVPALFVIVNMWLLWSTIRYVGFDALKGLAIVASGVPAYVLFRIHARPAQKVVP